MVKRRLALEAFYHSDHYDAHKEDLSPHCAERVRVFDPYGHHALRLLEEIEGRR